MFFNTHAHTSTIYIPRLQTRVWCRLSSVSTCQMVNGCKLSSKSCDWTRVRAFFNTSFH
jgi:hypothetical protein